MHITKTDGVTITDIIHRNATDIDYEFEMPDGETVICKSKEFWNGESHKTMEMVADKLWNEGCDVCFEYSLDDKGGKILRDLRAFN